jgi:hypothetical protein
MSENTAALAAQTAGKSLVLSGARALVEIGGVIVGCFESCTWTSAISTEIIHTLGRYSAHEVVSTAYEAVDINCSGFRIMGANPNDAKGGGFAKISQLLTQETVTITIVDRQSATDATGAGSTVVLTVVGCVPTSYSSGFQAKSASRFQISYRGTRADYSSDASDGESASAIASLI